MSLGFGGFRVLGFRVLALKVLGFWVFGFKADIRIGGFPGRVFGISTRTVEKDPNLIRRPGFDAKTRPEKLARTRRASI